MKPAFEAPRTTPDDTSLAVSARAESVFAWNWHYHPEIELTWIETGHGIRLVGDHSEGYRRYDLVLLGPNLPHTWSSSDGGKSAGPTSNRAVVVQFRPQAFPVGLWPLPEFAAIGQLFARAARGIRFPEGSGRKIGPKMKALLRCRELDRWLRLASILNDLAATPGTTLASAGYHHRRSYKLGSRLERVVNHLEERFQEENSLDEMARTAGLTPSAFSRFFRRMTQRTFVDYRNACRVRAACRLLTETDLPITEIAYACGFNNLGNFHRRFRTGKHMPPGEYRRLRNPVLALR